MEALNDDIARVEQLLGLDLTVSLPDGEQLILPLDQSIYGRDLKHRLLATSFADHFSEYGDPPFQPRYASRLLYGGDIVEDGVRLNQIGLQKGAKLFFKPSELDLEHVPPVVIDTGTSMVKAGMCGEHAPRATSWNVVGRRKEGRGAYRGYSSTLLTSQVSIGNDARERKGPLLDLWKPMENGVVQDRGDMEKVWSWVIDDELRLIDDRTEEEGDGSELDGGVTDVMGVMLGQVPWNPAEQQENAAQFWFEDRKVFSLALMEDSVMALSGAGRTSGMVVDVGHECSRAVPVHEGAAQKDALQYQHFGAGSVKDGPEELFQDGPSRVSLPALVAKAATAPAVASMAQPSIDVILCGGGSLFSGLDARLGKELGKGFRVVNPGERFNLSLPYFGGQILGDLSSFQGNFMGYKEYEESGPRLVHTYVADIPYVLAAAAAQSHYNY